MLGAEASLARPHVTADQSAAGTPHVKLLFRSLFPGELSSETRQFCKFSSPVSRYSVGEYTPILRHSERTLSRTFGRSWEQIGSGTDDHHLHIAVQAKAGQMSRRGTEEPPFLSVGTEVSAKYRGAFCEAKVKIVKKLVKCKVTFKNDSSSTQITDDCIIKGPLRVGAHVEVKAEDGQVREAVINKVMDSSTYTVVFDDGDERTLRRTSLCLKGEKHFSESETLDNLPLTDPENFGTPVVHGSSKGKRRRRRWGTPTRVSSDEESEEETPTPKKSASKSSKEKETRKVLCVESTDKRRNWFPALPVNPSSADVKLTRGKDQIAVRSFRDGKYHVVNKEDTREFNKEQAERIESPSLKPAIDLAIKYLDTGDVPASWDNNKKRTKEESDAEEDDEEEEDEESSDEDSEEKEKFLEDLYRFMEDKGTPITKPPVLGYRDLNLFKLYELVQGQGGFDEVTKDCGLWKELYSKMGIPAQHSAASHNIKAAYKKYLHDYEEFKKKQKQQGTPRARGRPPKSPRGADRSENKEEDRKDKKEEDKKKQDKREEEKKKKKEESEDEGDEDKDQEEEARPRRGRRPSSARRPPVPEKKEEKDKVKEPEKAAEKGSKPKEKDKDSKASTKSDDESDDEEDDTETKDQKKEDEASDDDEKPPLGDYAIGDKIQVKYGRGRQQRIYEAKVLEAEMEEGELMYYVHYAGWNVRYDEWINLDRIVGPADNKSNNKGGKKGEPVHSGKNGKTPPPNKGLGKRGRPPGSGRKKEEDDKDEKESTTSEPAPPTPEPPKTQLKKTDKTVQVKVERLEKMDSPRVARLTRSNSTADATLPFDIEALKPKRTRRSSGQSVTEPQPSEPPSSPEQIAEEAEGEEEREDHLKIAAKEKDEKTTVQEKSKEEKSSTEGTSDDQNPPVEEEKADVKKDDVKEEAETKEPLSKEGDKEAEIDREDSKEAKKEQSKNKRRELSTRRKRRESVEKAPPEIEDTRQEGVETAIELENTERVTKEEEEKVAKEQEMILAGGDSQKLPAAKDVAKEQPSKDEQKEDPDKQEMPLEEKEDGDIEKTEKSKKKSAKKGKGRKSGADQKSKAAEERRHTKEETSQSLEHTKEEDPKDSVRPQNEDHIKEGSSFLQDAPISVSLPIKEERSSAEASKEEAQVNRISPPDPVSSAPTVTPNSTRSKRASSPTDSAFTPPSKKTKGKTDKSDRSLARSDRSSPVPEAKSRRGKSDKVGRTSPRQDRSSPVPSSGSNKKTKKEKVEKEKLDRISPVLPSVADAVNIDQENQVPEKSIKKEPEDNRTPPCSHTAFHPPLRALPLPAFQPRLCPRKSLSPPHEEALPPRGQEESKSTKNEMDMNLELDSVSEQPGVGNESPVQDSSTASSSSIGSGNMPTNGSTSASGTEAVTPSRKRKHEDVDSAGSKRKRKHHRHKKGRHHKHNNVNCSDSESSEKDNKDSHHKHNGSSPRKRSRSPSDPTSPSRPPKFHFSVEESLRYQGEARIDFLQTKLQEMKTIYGALKSEVASIDRKKKRHKRKERERAEREAAQALASAAHKNNSGNMSSVSSPSTVSVECR
ncbi:LOW QUALITY PROTEIN: AT-rich interactive domain-containing protein 4B-like [Branchiostoma floridae]|uniref:LOW QUALITY PROTEIN: AT-rich interactive domain-containing protein 4B-like n=1 Tax=Branchiostoma floridae TaxID=7739 RepID=A0A9J7KWH0_BRAFL|nr:LOW QUALITY PROTEIN: AT-rich interactive domain-containing protein 4B-like [Branchiostoma floridae]